MIDYFLWVKENLNNFILSVVLTIAVYEVFSAIFSLVGKELD